MAILIDDIISEYGAYYKQGTQSLRNLHLAIMDQSETDQLFSLMPTNDTRLQEAFVDITDVLQGYQDDFTARGDTEFTPRVIDLFNLKIDISENPTKLEKTWLGFLASNKLDRTQWPFIRFWIERLVLPKARENWELKGIFGGVKGAVTPGTPQPIENAVDGIRKQFNSAITAGDLDPLVLGATPTDPEDFVEYCEAFFKLIPKKYRPFLTKLAMSDTKYLLFREGMRKKYNMNYAQTDLTTIIDTNLQVIGLRSHEGSDKIWTTLDGNAVMAIKKPENQNIFEIEKIDRKVKAYTDYWKVCSFYIWKWVFTNDVDLV
jgi:hypothetical protein